MKKFNPLYRITVYTQNETIIIKLPITCKMTITRGLMSESISANIQLYNLALSTRNMIFQDMFVIDSSKWKYIHIEAGYGGEESMSRIFKGRILQAYSHKAGGQTDVITEIQAQALDIFDCQSSHTFEAGTTYKEAYNILASDLPNCIIGNTGSLEGILRTATAFDGNTFEQLNKLSGGNTFVDNGILNTIFTNECIDVPVPVISDSSGLLETPMRRDASLSIKMIFQPDLIIGQLLEIKSNIFTDYNGQYKVLGFTHDLLFSASQSGTRTTTCELWIGPLLPGAQITETGDKVQNNFKKVKGTDIMDVNPQSAGTNWIMPCKGRIAGLYGEKRTDHIHNGIDIAVPIGTPVKAIADGKVIAARPASGYGKYVVIDHGKINGITVTSEYGHISRYCVSYGRQVKQGQIIAYSGNEGKSEGPHLHLTIREGTYQGRAVSPYKYIKR